MAVPAELPTYHTALEALSNGLTGLTTQFCHGQRLRLAFWKQAFSMRAPWVISAAAPVFRPSPPAPAFSADSLRNEWGPIWAPTPYNEEGILRSWEAVAARPPFQHSPVPADWTPPRTAFHEALAGIHGAPELDEWRSEEIQAIARNFPFTVDEPHDLWCDVARSAAKSSLDPRLDELLFGSGAVGIPKRTSDASGPISVASVMACASASACAEALPSPVRNQWACFKSISILAGLTQWLSSIATAECGAELDLAQAFDTVNHRIAATDLRQPHEVMQFVKISK